MLKTQHKDFLNSRSSFVYRNVIVHYYALGDKLKKVGKVKKLEKYNNHKKTK